MVELAEDDLAPQVPTAEVTEDPEIVAGRLRSALGISIEEQFSWRKPEDALKGWIEAVEDLGSSYSAPATSTSRRCVASRCRTTRPPLSSSTPSTSPGARRSRSSTSSPTSPAHGGTLRHLRARRAADKRVETFCNVVAAAIATPKEEFLKESWLRPPGRGRGTEPTSSC